MARFLFACTLSLLSLSAVAQSPGERDGEDFAIYLQSVGGPATVEVCGSVLPEPERLRLAFTDWSLRNKDRAAHGRTLALTKKSESELAAWETALVADFKEKLAAKEPARKLEMCQGFESIYASPTFK